MPTDAQTLTDIIATQGYDKLSKRYLLEAILAAVASGGGGGGSCSAQSGAGSPLGSVTPAFIGQLYHDTVADAYYRSTGLTAADWTAIGGGGSVGTFIGATDVQVGHGLLINSDPASTFFKMDSVVSIDAGTGPALVLFSYPLVTSFSVLTLATVIGTVAISDFPVIQTINFPSLTSITGYIEIDSDVGPNLALASISFPVLTTIGGAAQFSGNPALSNFSAPMWVPSDGNTINFNGDALNATSVEFILRRCVLAGVTTCTIDLSGGTNTGLASLSAQGQADAATLGAQLTINP